MQYWGITLSKMRDDVYVYAYSRAFPIEKNKRSKDFRSACCAHRGYRSLVLVFCATQSLTTVNLGFYVWRSGEQAISSRHSTLQGHQSKGLFSSANVQNWKLKSPYKEDLLLRSIILIFLCWSMFMITLGQLCVQFTCSGEILTRWWLNC